jgi:hypothetical protein
MARYEAGSINVLKGFDIQQSSSPKAAIEGRPTRTSISMNRADV